MKVWSIEEESVPAPPSSYEDLEAQAEEFMRMQSAKETGEQEPSVSYDTTEKEFKEFGTDEVTDEEVQVYTRDVIDSLKTLLKVRDMTLNEVKLILAIEDPRAQEARRVYGIEVSRGFRV